jgi:hypothetical protein
MTDHEHELLEAAARAAGVQVLSMNDGRLLVDFRGVGMRPWNPLSRYDDELELAEKLGISIDFTDCCAWKRLPGGQLIQEFWGGDFDPRHSHAVLRAAVAIASSTRTAP